jgi:AraC family transcriptional regulator of adaptative response/methylated-DNA-[protein]-cysteine methyltransferase
MNSDHSHQQEQAYKLVARALNWVAENQADQPDLERLSVEMGLSPYHLQRTFQDWAGVSPKQFLKSLTRQDALARLKRGSSVLDAALESGLSGPGRLHDLMITTEALSPGEVRKLGKGVAIQYGSGPTPFGQAVLAWTDRGINFLGFCEDTGYDTVVHELKNQWPSAEFKLSQKAAAKQLEKIFSDFGKTPLRLWLTGSPFQLKVWEALLSIPENSHASYGQIAAYIGQPRASRAVGSAVGSNPVAWIIPCHRVIRKLGGLGGYRWGEITKQAMIGYEAFVKTGSTGSYTSSTK